MRFTDWISLQEPSEVPDSGGVFQVKILDVLLNYPSGKSAMFYYGYADNIRYGVKKFREEIVPLLHAGDLELMVRWMPVADVEDRFKKQLHFFQTNFGSLPAGNELLLKQKNPESGKS